ncbi:hypothetical protein H0H92_014691 [Tricholoma furcatifolium]|nr:hypothetical protein H0H92_014691 [Tricholoma furcatifolium]
MSTFTLIEQRPPFILMLASRVPTYAHILVSLLAVILFMAAVPSLATAKPAARATTARKPRSSSVTSATSTLVETDENADAVKATPRDVGNEGKLTPYFLNILAHELQSYTVVPPFLKNPLSTVWDRPLRWRSRARVEPVDVVEAVQVAESDVVGSPNTKDEASDASVVVEAAVHEATECEARQSSDEPKAHANAVLSSPKKPKAFKRIARRASMALGFARRS